MALSEGIGGVLYAASTRGPTVYTTFIATRDGVARHRDAFAAMTRAIGQMQAWLVDHSAEELAGSVAPFFPDLPNHTLLSALQWYHQAGIWARAPKMSQEGFSRLASSFLSGGLVARLPRYEDCVEPTLG